MAEQRWRPAIFASAFHPSLGGVEELVRQLAHQQQASGDDPMVLTNRWPKDLAAFETYEGIAVHRFSFNVPGRQWRHLAGFLGRTMTTRKQVAEVLRRHKANVVHVQCVSSNAYYAYLAARRLGLPLVVSLQGELTMDATGVYQRSRFLPWLLRRLMKDADIVTACSADTLAEAEAFTGVRLGDRGRVIYNGVRLSEFEGVEAARRVRPYVLGIGRHVPQKGFDVLLRAFAALPSHQRAAYDLVIAGDGPENKELRRLAEALDLGDHVDFVGRCDRARTTALFKGCRVFVLPSRHEPMGIVNLEAMAAGKPVVASRVGGVPELVQHGTTGLLVRPSDAGALSGSLQRLLEEDGPAESMGAAGAQAVIKFDWAVIAEEYEQAYADATANRKSTRG